VRDVQRRRAESVPATGSPVVTAASPGPRSLDRAFALLEHLADAGGSAGLAQLARSSGLPAGTVHRIMRSLLDAGFARQDASRRYWLGARLVRLGEAAGGDVAHRAQPLLTALVQQFGETASLAMLDGDWVIYLAQVPSPHSMRSSADAGRRARPHCTAVGKALLSQMSEEKLHALIRRTGMPALTQHTITTEQALTAEIEQIRANGYAVDDEEQELGLRCVAVPVDWPGADLAISVSGPTCRIGTGQLGRIIPAL
jgi:IclR family acetate operon transcriptional repressor